MGMPLTVELFCMDAQDKWDEGLDIGESRSFPLISFHSSRAFGGSWG